MDVDSDLEDSDLDDSSTDDEKPLRPVMSLRPRDFLRTEPRDQLLTRIVREQFDLELALRDKELTVIHEQMQLGRRALHALRSWLHLEQAHLLAAGGARGGGDRGSGGGTSTSPTTASRLLDAPSDARNRNSMRSSTRMLRIQRQRREHASHLLSGMQTKAVFGRLSDGTYVRYVCRWCGVVWCVVR